MDKNIVISNNHKDRIAHYYKEFHPYKKFDIYTGKINVQYENGFTEIINDAKIEFTYLPYPRIELSFTSHSQQSYDNNMPPFSIKHPLHNVDLKFNILSQDRSISHSFQNKIIASLREYPKYSNNLKIQTVKFYLVNFLYIMGEPVSYEKNNCYRGRCVIEEKDNFKITIDALENIKKINEFLKNNHTYAITHICKLEKKDNSDFYINEIKNILEKLYYYLSFVKGSWTTPILITGFDTNDEFIWEFCGDFPVESYRYIKNWFPETQYQHFQNLFPNFCEKWNDSKWNDVLKKSIDWYLEINKSSISIEGCIVLQQVTLEMLANFILVENKKIISSGSFSKGISASDKIRLLLSQCNLPLNTPDTLKNLTQVQKSSSAWNDGAESLVQIRNSLVHDTSQKTKKIHNIINNARVNKSDVIDETYILGQWYVEIILLKIFNYQGNYLDRTKQEIWKNRIGENFNLVR